MLPKGLRSNSIYDYAWYILSYVEIAYKPRNTTIPVQVKDECRLLTKTVVCLEHCNVKEIRIFGFNSRWKTNTCLSNLAHNSYREQDPDGTALN